MTTTPAAHGHVAPGYEPVAEAFDRAIAHSPQGGGAVSVLLDGSPVVDLWGGTADIRTGAPWGEGTTSVVFSMTKGVMTLLVARLVEAGVLDLDTAVTTYWPEFGQAGKGSITVRQVMAHRAGLPYPVRDLTRDDLLAWHPVIRALEEQEPLWAPDTAHSYHSLTWGWLVGEIVRRATRLEIGAAVQTWLTGPTGAEFWVGVPAEELSRISYLVPGPGLTFDLPDGFPNRLPLVRGFTLGGAFPSDVAGDGTGLNDPELLQHAIVPAGLGVGTARAVAQLWSSAVADTETTTAIDPRVLDDMTAPRSSGEQVWGIPGAPPESWGTGFHIPSAPMPMLGPSSFGHGGAGGQLSFVDRESRIAFAFLTNDLQVADDQRVTELVDAVRSAVQQAPVG